MRTKNRNSTLRFVAYGAMLIFIATSITSSIVILISLAGYRTSNQVVTANIQKALNSGAVAFPSEYNRSQKTGIDTWNDCLVLEIATFPHLDLVTALTSLEFTYQDKGEHPCDHLSDKIGPQELGKPLDDYWRYWWGQATLLNIVIDFGGLSLSSYQLLLKLSCYILILTIGATALFRYRQTALPLLPIIGALVFGFGLPLYGQSIAHAPGLIVGMFLLLLYMIAGIDRMSLSWQFIYLFIVGGLVFYFDLLNGHLVAVLICFALVRVISVRAFGLGIGTLPSRLRLWRTTTAVVLLSTAYFIGAVSIALLRLLLRASLRGQNIFDVATEWLMKLSHRTSDLTDIELPYTGTANYVRHAYANVEVGTFPYIGRSATVFIYAFCGVLYLSILGWLARNAKKLGSQQKDTFLALFLITIIVPLWYAVFLNHTIVHFWMTGRLLSLFFALAVSFAMFIVFDKSLSASSQTRLKLSDVRCFFS